MSHVNETVKQLTDRMLAKHGEWKGLVEKGNAMTMEDLEKIPGVKAEYLELKGHVDRFNSASSVSDLQAEEDYLRKPVRNFPHPNDVNAALKSGTHLIGSTEAGYTEIECRNGVIQIADEVGAGSIGEKQWNAIQKSEYKAAFTKLIRKKGDNRFMSGAEMKTLEEGLDDQGGYTVPIDVLTNKVIQRKPTPSRIAAMCSQLNTSREVLEMMKVNYSSDNIYSTGFRVTKTGETPSSATAMRVTDTNLFGTIKIPVHTFMISAPITVNMVEDSAIDPIGWLSSKFAETVEILKDDKVINGTGKMEPRGLVNAVASAAAGQGTDDPNISYVVSGDANTLTPDGLINLALDVPEQYEDACKYYFNKVSTFKAIRQMKDLNDRYLFGTGVQDSGLATATRPSDLLGYPYVFSGLFPNVSAGTFPVFFGDMSGYQLVNRIGFSVQILRELYAESNAIVLLGRVRFGGQVIESWKLRAQKVSA